MKNKIHSFIKSCLEEYPVYGADIISVRIDAKYGNIEVYLSKYGSPLSYLKKQKIAEIAEREDVKSVALEVYE